MDAVDKFKNVCNSFDGEIKDKDGELVCYVPSKNFMYGISEWALRNFDDLVNDMRNREDISGIVISYMELELPKSSTSLGDYDNNETFLEISPCGQVYYGKFTYESLGHFDEWADAIADTTDLDEKWEYADILNTSIENISNIFNNPNIKDMLSENSNNEDIDIRKCKIDVDDMGYMHMICVDVHEIEPYNYLCNKYPNQDYWGYEYDNNKISVHETECDDIEYYPEYDEYCCKLINSNFDKYDEKIDEELLDLENKVIGNIYDYVYQEKIPIFIDDIDEEDDSYQDEIPIFINDEQGE